jgi:predicted nucleic acid-binding protein
MLLTLAKKQTNHGCVARLQQDEVVMPQQEPQVSRDTKDNKFLAAAEAANADFLVSEDGDLLDLVAHRGTRIIPAHEFLQILKTHRRAA